MLVPGKGGSCRSCLRLPTTAVTCCYLCPSFPSTAGTARATARLLATRLLGTAEAVVVCVQRVLWALAAPVVLLGGMLTRLLRAVRVYCLCSYATPTRCPVPYCLAYAATAIGRTAIASTATDVDRTVIAYAAATELA
eukprot:190555-Rhodomonas_salina.2